MKPKTVTFSPDTYSPAPAELCDCCGHRNIIPKIKELFICAECYNRICGDCMNTLRICLDCEEELFNSDCSESYEDIDEFVIYTSNSSVNSNG